MTIESTSPALPIAAQPYLFDGPTAPFPMLVQDVTDDPIQGVVYVERGDTDAVVVLHEGMREHQDVVGEGLGHDSSGWWDESFPGQVAELVADRLPEGFAATVEWSPLDDAFSPALEIRVSATAELFPRSHADLQVVDAVAPAVKALYTMLDAADPSYVFTGLAERNVPAADVMGQDRLFEVVGAGRRAHPAPLSDAPSAGRGLAMG